ncbi:MAG: helix-turn-helix domain-containing protein [Pseudomonadota bacterium]
MSNVSSETESKTAFREAFIRLVDEIGVSLAEISRKTGVSKPQLEKLNQRAVQTTNVHDAIRIARYFGMSVEEMIYDLRAESTEKLLGKIRSLPTGERLQMLHIQLDDLINATRLK